ncbi:MAG TPA: carboxypeptidase regulatory-like domain-containing protein [Pyrinomonadaceae bacterium]|nr:carboxypeptidase regulatory-like domain-containing protein [Pyrinomonadaceae bacterium]
MSSTTRRVLTFAAVLSCFAVHSVAYSQISSQKKVATGSVSGRVTIHAKGRSGIIVGLRVAEVRGQSSLLWKAVTDADGNYQITNVPAGNYQIAPVAPAFVVSDTDAFRRAGKTLVITEGETVTGINFSIVRGGVITGRVTQTDGSPVIEERVTVVPVNQANQRYVSSSFQTDDRGVYRVFGLPAGEYKVSVGQNEMAQFSPANRGRPVYERVFYPDATNITEAKAITVDEGSEATNIDITVSPSAPGFAASGVVVEGETNKPVPNIRFGLQRVSANRRSPPMIGIVATSGSQGEFRLENLAPGKYAIFILPQQHTDLRADSNQFDVIDHDVSGLIVKASKGASITGTLVLEGITDQRVLAQVSQLRLFVYVRSERGTGGSGFGQTSTIGTDGSFRLGGLQAGIASFNLGFQDRTAGTGFVISRIEREGLDHTRGLSIEAGEQIAGVKIVVVYGTGTVRGTVKIENGPDLPEVRLLVRLTKTGAGSANLRPQEADARGRFLLEGVPAGVYDLHVSAFVPGSRARMPSTKQSITVNDGAVTEVDLTLNMAPNPTPAP